MPQQLRPGRLSRLLLLSHGSLVLLTLGLAGLLTYVTAEAQTTWVRLVLFLGVAAVLGLCVAWFSRWLTQRIDQTFARVTAAIDSLEAGGEETADLVDAVDE